MNLSTQFIQNNRLIMMLMIASSVLFFKLDAQEFSLNTIENKIVDLGDVTNINEDLPSPSQLVQLFKDVEIVMLGEQSHGEATTYETKIKLIKYLHEELGFDILAFESGFYDCQKASELMDQGTDVREAMGNSIFSIWSTTKELKPLAAYLEQSNQSATPLKLVGFDSQFAGRLSERYFLSDLSKYLIDIDPEITSTKEWTHLNQNFKLITDVLGKGFKKIKKNNPEQDTIYINQLIGKIENKSTGDLSSYWIQALKNLKVYIADIALKTNNRDRQMADNLIWIKEKYPSSKIICWGATSHFLYNSEQIRMKNTAIQVLAGNYYKKQPMMGHYIKEKYGDKLLTIGFTTYEGTYGLFRRKKIKPAKEGTLEFVLNQSIHDNFLLPLKGINTKGYLSRPLGNFYMKNDIAQVMDAVIFNRKMRDPILDANFFLKIYPENKYIKPDPVQP